MTSFIIDNYKFSADFYSSVPLVATTNEMHRQLQEQQTLQKRIKKQMWELQAEIVIYQNRIEKEIEQIQGSEGILEEELDVKTIFEKKKSNNYLQLRRINPALVGEPYFKSDWPIIDLIGRIFWCVIYILGEYGFRLTCFFKDGNCRQWSNLVERYDLYNRRISITKISLETEEIKEPKIDRGGEIEEQQNSRNKAQELFVEEKGKGEDLLLRVKNTEEERALQQISVSTKVFENIDVTAGPEKVQQVLALLMGLLSGKIEYVNGNVKSVMVQLVPQISSKVNQVRYWTVDSRDSLERYFQFGVAGEREISVDSDIEKLTDEYIYGVVITLDPEMIGTIKVDKGEQQILENIDRIIYQVVSTENNSFDGYKNVNITPKKSSISFFPQMPMKLSINSEKCAQNNTVANIGKKLRLVRDKENLKILLSTIEYNKEKNKWITKIHFSLNHGLKNVAYKQVLTRIPQTINDKIAKNFQKKYEGRYTSVLKIEGKSRWWNTNMVATFTVEKVSKEKKRASSSDDK